jgi:hypothetical protein
MRLTLEMEDAAICRDTAERFGEESELHEERFKQLGLALGAADRITKISKGARK